MTSFFLFSGMINEAGVAVPAKTNLCYYAHGFWFSLIVLRHTGFLQVELVWDSVCICWKGIAY